jgi:60 kDa SS-A/Ro ribonucleoprotein
MELDNKIDNAHVPDVPMDMLTSLPLDVEHWIALARKSPWQATRMNLNTFARHAAFDDAKTVRLVAEKLRDREQIARSRVLPYQLMVAYHNADPAVPAEVRVALQDAMEIAMENVPAFTVMRNGLEQPAKVFIFLDVSGSMQSPVTGQRGGGTTSVRCVDVAALFAAAILRRNPLARVIPFSDDVVRATINPRDSVMTNAKTLASLPAGGTNCSAPLKLLTREKETGDVCVFVSDNQSWIDTSTANGPTETMKQWQHFKHRSPQAKLVAIDLQPYGTVQARSDAGVLNVGGFSDAVFNVIAEFVKGPQSHDHWVDMIEKVTIN